MIIVEGLAMGTLCLFLNVRIWMQIGSSMSFFLVSHSGALGFKNLFALEWE